MVQASPASSGASICKCGRAAVHKGICTVCWSELTKRGAEKRRANRERMAAEEERRIAEEAARGPRVLPAPQHPSTPAPQHPEGAGPQIPARLAELLELATSPQVQRWLALPDDVQRALRVLSRC